MCDVCADFLHLLVSYEARITSNNAKHTALLKSEVEIAFGYIQSWQQRQCMCLYRDLKNFERFNLVLQSIICLVLHCLKNINKLVEELKSLAVDFTSSGGGGGGDDCNQQNPSTNEDKSEIGEGETVSIIYECLENNEDGVDQNEEKWILPEIEKLLLLISKAYLLNFPLFIAYKHGVHSRLDEISADEAQHLSLYCDLHDNEIPVFLLRNVTLFCNSGGFTTLMACFDNIELPATTAHAITLTATNVKLWLNYRCVIQLFIPFRSKVLQFICKLSDQELRNPPIRSMADFVWGSIRDPLDSSINFDIEGLALAFKYFNSTTLTMRLTGMAQINAHINLFNEICTTETVGEVEIIGQKLGDWLTTNQIIEHLFGPNLHVEVIKQSHVVLNFLAVENQISEEHINLIWQSAQLKHCSKPIYDILPTVVKNLSTRPAMHLYSLLCRLDPKEHTEQSIYITSALTKGIWSRDGNRPQMDIIVDNILPSNVTASSSENSVSIDGSNTEEEHHDDSSCGSRKSPIDIEGLGSDSGAPPCKQARRKKNDDLVKKISKSKSQIIDNIECIKSKSKSPLRRISNAIGNSSSDDDVIQTEGVRKKIRKRRKNNGLPLSRLAHELVEAIWGGDTHSEEDILNDSDCSDTQVHTAVLKHLHGEGPYIRAVAETHISELLNGTDRDGSYSSPMSNKSEKNMGDFDDDESPCEDEIAHLVSRSHGCLPPFTVPMTIRETESNKNNIIGGKCVAGSSGGRTKIDDLTVGFKEDNDITFKVNDVCQPGNTLLWDLLQDDKIGQLGEVLALEAEKTLGNLLCFTTDRLLRTKFIEGCLHNLANNKSIIVSLRLLPKLFASFQQFRSADTQQVTMWAERHHKMMSHFFNNIKHYSKVSKSSNDFKVLNQNGTPMYSHMTQVSVRLHFLSSIFSSMGSPKAFRLSLEQVDALWEWLAHDTECADCLFAWLQCQAKGVDQHALGIEALQHLYLKKMPELRPEDFSMVALGLFQQLCSLARLAIAHYEKQIDTVSTTSANIVGMYHLWKIALRAQNTEVSMAAIQYINSYYMGQHLRLEKEFISSSMDHLIQAAGDLKTSEHQDYALMCVQRGLMLLNTHLETFRRRYAFHLRRWALEGKEIGSHSNLRNESSGPPIRIILQPAGLSEKSVLHMHACDLIAELKAEISKWWESLQSGVKVVGVTTPVLGLLLNEGPLRIITQGQELTSDYDERNLGDVGFKDNQIVYVSLGGRGARRKEPLDHPTLQPPPPKECLPTVLLLQPKYFEELFGLMQTLGEMKVQGKNGNFLPHTKAQLLSRRVWDILAILPINPNLLESFKTLDDTKDTEENNDKVNEQNSKLNHNTIKQKIKELLDAKNLQKFMYSLHIVESLAVKTQQSSCCGGEHGNRNRGGSIRLSSASSKSNSVQSKKSSRRSTDGACSSEDKIIDVDLTAVVSVQPSNKSSTESCKETEGNSDDMEEKENNHRLFRDDKKEITNDITAITISKWNEIFIQCGGVRHLFDIFMSGVLQSSSYASDTYNEWRHDCLASLLRILCLLGFEEMRPDDMILVIPKPHAFMLELMDVDGCLKRLSSILNDEAHYHHANQLQLRTGFWGRAQVVQFVMNIMVSFVHSSKEAQDTLWTNTAYCGWLQKFILDDPEPAVRREICAGLYRISLGNSKNCQELLAPLLQKLVSFLPVAEKMTYQHQNPHLVSDEGKEPYGPACRDYFWLLARLVDTLSPTMVKDCLDDPQSGAVDIETLSRHISSCIMEREFYETRHGFQDDGLVGLINLLSNLVKYNPPYKFSVEALNFIERVFEFLFDLPTAQNRQKPKCKSQTSRAAAYDLLVELCKNCPNNYSLLHGKLLEQHRPGPHAPYPWDYWPRDDGRSECGYVGLTNLGATCYMASCIQHLYMMPQAREAILSVPAQGSLKHAPTLHELQRMFAYLMESERKSYNPRSFCRVYQMDHQPLNTGEQKDMAEFFIDLVSKLEEMTPDLKVLVKRLFCGTLSNNVVSLDCGHVSRTAEEFYTVRCQVADMRNLQESLDEVTVKDTLEGDNMYTCSQCGKKVRAEKRACFKKLPQILCFNTMRYTFNMITMLKEKVNTHFSFPNRLDMSDYVEKSLMPHQYLENKKKREKKAENMDIEIKSSSSDDASANGEKNEKLLQKQRSDDLVDWDEEEDEFSECFEYELVGVTVHTGTADGGHYYSFIKERENSQQQERWFLFNDAEVKPFDPSQIAAECFGGEMTSKTYDSVTEKYLDFSFEKTNSAYMLFYERKLPQHLQQRLEDLLSGSSTASNIQPKSESSNLQKINEQDKIIKENASEEHELQPKILTSTLQNKSQDEIGLNETENHAANSTSCNNSNDLTNLEPTNSNSNNCDIDVKSKNATKNSDVVIVTPMPSTSTSPQSLSPFLSDAIIGNSALMLHNAILNNFNKSKAEQNKKSLLNEELEEWIWQDNRNFLQDRNIFEHTYFNFMWQICGHIPQTLLMQTDVTCMAAQLSVSFFIETFIHAKEKPTMVLWVELLTKQFNASQEACEWFLSHMSTEPWWPVQVLIQCPNQMVRQMFQRLVIHVIQRLRSTHYTLYLKNEIGDDDKEMIGNASCITRFMKSLILLMEHGAKAHLRHLSEFFCLLYEFSRMGDEETLFLLRINVIRSVADFYLGNKNQDCIDAGSDNDDNSSDETLSVEKARPASLDKMIALVANLVERSRGADFRLHLAPKDYNAIAGGKGFPFLYQQIKDNINPHQTRHLIHALCRWDERLANQIITMLFSSVTKHTELCGPFFKLLTLLTETQGGPSGLPCFSQLVLQRVWDAAEYCPQSALDWLAVQAPRNKIAHAWILQSAENWVEQFLMSHNNSRVRNAAAYLLVSLVPSQGFRSNFRSHSLHKFPVNIPHRELSNDAQIILHTIINLLLHLLRPARSYADIGIHGTTKLTAYFSLLTYCMTSKTEKLMLGPYVRSLWDLFHPRLSEPSVPAHHNKHALLAFWHHSTCDCPENAQMVSNCQEITRNIAFNYILADHDDSEIVAYNRAMLPAYYGLLRLCCQQSRALTRQLAAHQNLQWAFKNITPHPTQYSAAVEELFRLMSLFAARQPDANDQEKLEVSTFRRTTLAAYLTGLDARVSWGTLINALRILVDNDEDRLFVVYNGGIEMAFDALHTLHSMYHEATACHVSGDLQELLTELVLLVSTLRLSSRLDSPQKKRVQSTGSTGQNPVIKGLHEAVKRLATFLNTYNPPEIRNLSLDILKEMIRNPNLEITSILAPIFTHCHLQAQNSPNSVGPLGPFFPRRGGKSTWPAVPKGTPRPPRPMVQMSIPQNQVLQKGLDKEFDVYIDAFYKPYHDFLDIMMRMAVNTNQLNESLVKLSCLAAIESAPLHFNLFPKFWVGIYNNKSTNKYVDLLINNPILVDYIDILLRDERISLNDSIVRNFLEIYYPKVTSRLALSRLIYSISYTLNAKDDLDELCGDLHAIRIIAKTSGIPISVRKQLKVALSAALTKNRTELIEKDETPPKKKVKMTPPSNDAGGDDMVTTPALLPSSPKKAVEEQELEEPLAGTSSTITLKPTENVSTSNNNNSTIKTNDESSPSTSFEEKSAEEKQKKPLDESNDADDEDDDSAAGKKKKSELAKKVADNKIAEKKAKELCYIQTIEGYIRALLDLLNDDDIIDEDDDDEDEEIDVSAEDDIGESIIIESVDTGSPYFVMPTNVISDEIDEISTSVSKDSP